MRCSCPDPRWGGRGRAGGCDVDNGCSRTARQGEWDRNVVMYKNVDYYGYSSGIQFFPSCIPRHNIRCLSDPTRLDPWLFFSLLLSIP